MEYFTREDIEDIPTEELSFIRLDKHVYCYDQYSFKNMIKFAKDQKVRGECKPAVANQPLDCKWFVPINLGQNIYITMDNYNHIKSKLMDKRKFELTNKRIVDFTTGLHMMSEKSGKDNVYELVPAKFDLKKYIKPIKAKKKKKEKQKKEIKSMGKRMSAMKISDIKKICKEKGVKGYSKLKKAQLVEKCLDDKQKLKAMTLAQLKKKAKSKKIKKYSTMKREELIKKLLS